MAKEETAMAEPPNASDPADKYMDMGSGIDLGDAPLHPSQEPLPEGSSMVEEKIDRDKTRPYDYLLDDNDKKQFVDDPSYADQYMRYPETVRRVGPTLEVFDLSDETAKLEMNRLMAGSQNQYAPRSAVAVLDRQWDAATSNWKILAQVYHFKYLKIRETD